LKIVNASDAPETSKATTERRSFCFEGHYPDPLRAFIVGTAWTPTRRRGGVPAGLESPNPALVYNKPAVLRSGFAIEDVHRAVKILVASRGIAATAKKRLNTNECMTGVKL